MGGGKEEFIFSLLEKADIAILIIDIEKRKTVFSNSYFDLLEDKIKRELLKEVFNYIKSKKFNETFNIHEVTLDVNKNYKYSVSPLFSSFYIIMIKKEMIDFRVTKEEIGFKIISNVVSEISHEIGNPLTSVRTALEVMLQNIDSWSEDKKRYYLNVAIKGVDRISDYLTYIRNFSINKKLNMEYINLKDIIDLIINDNLVIFESRNINIEVDIDENIIVYADKNIIYQVVLNLLLNSNQVLKDGDKISIEVERFSDYFIKLIYRNNGLPIPDNIKEKIFIPYFSTKKDIIKGAKRGIGLAISLKLINRMGGTIILEEPPKGWGVQFSIYIPVINKKN